jgi:hypothetical protein
MIMIRARGVSATKRSEPKSRRTRHSQEFKDDALKLT